MDGLTRFKLTVQYDGTGLFGWQRQPELPTVQGHLAQALGAVLQLPADALATTMAAAGRTDAGVHAWGQVCHVDVPADVAARRELIQLLDGTNHFLPSQIRLVRVAVVGEDFHARFIALRRSYTYLLWHARSLRPDLRGRVGHSSRPLDLTAMQTALALLPTGPQDFSGFRDAECQSHNPVCTLHELTLQEREPGLLALRIEADHFLHHMVRNLMGTLVEIGLGQRPTDNLCSVLAGRDRKLAGPTFAASGLYFRQVHYAPHSEQAALGQTA